MRLTFMSVLSRPGVCVRRAMLFGMTAVCCHAAVDFTKPHSPSESGQLYNVGPTGMLGNYNSGAHSDQIRVRQVAAGSPADGKLIYGDVITAVNGVPFQKGGNLIVTLGNTIDEAEKAKNGGKITFTVWRDANVKKREALDKLDVRTLDVSDFVEVIEADDSTDLERYKSEHQVKQSVADEWKEAYEKVPIDASVRDVTLTLAVMPPYSESSPWDCPKIEKIREQAYPYLVKQMEEKGISRSGWNERMVPLALLASDHPEHVALVKKKMQEGGNSIEDHGRTWIAGYNILFVGEYVNRTGDKAFLPLLAHLAFGVANGESIGGTWGHGGSHRRKLWTDPYGPSVPYWCGGNYGAMNQAGGVCFYGMALAKKAGVNDPAVDAGIERAVRFNTTWVDKGGCPYGYHTPTGKEMNNGKNGPPGLAFHVLGQDYKARYFGLWSAVEASFGYTTGHGDGTFGRLWPQLASSMAGKEAVMEWMRKVRPYYTMSRQYDGTFVAPAGGMDLGVGSLFDPTAIAVLHLSIPLAKLYMTGRDLSPDVQASAKDLQNLRDRIHGVNIEMLSDDQIMDRLDTFNPNLRLKYAVELAKRQAAGRADLVPKLMALCAHKDARVREAARHALTTCGEKILEDAMPHMVEGLKDPAEIVRIASVRSIQAYVSAAPKGQGSAGARIKPFLNPLLDAAVTEFPDSSSDTINTTSTLMGLMLNTDHPFASDPFGQGLDPDKVRYAIERFFTMDPRYDIMIGHAKKWDRETCIQVAGPLLFIASSIDLNGKMFNGRALGPARELLAGHKFIEVAEAGLENAMIAARFPRDLSTPVYRDASPTGPPGLGKSALPWLRTLSLQFPSDYTEIIERIDAHEPPAGWTSIGDAAVARFFKDADAIRDRAAQIAYCRSELKPERKTWFRQMAAMTRLVELVGAEAIPDLGPYLVTEQWRMNDHCRKVIREMQAPGTAEALVRLTEDKDPGIVAGALVMLGERGDKEGVDIGLKILAGDTRARVRAGAAKAVYGGNKGAALEKLLDLMQREADREALNGYQEALYLGVKNPEQARVIAAQARKHIPSCPAPVRRSLYYLLGQIGGTENLQYLMERVSTKDRQEFTDIVEYISLSPQKSATAMMLQLLRQHKGSNRMEIVSERSAKRMVLGADVIGKVPDDAKLDYAEASLALDRNTEILRCLGDIPTPRAINLLLEYMKLGPEDVTQTCARSIERAARGVSADLPVDERKAVAQALTQVLEYISVVHIGGGQVASNKWILRWKELSDSIGNSLLRIYSPEEIIRHAIEGNVSEEDIDI